MPNIDGYNSDIQNEQIQKLAELFPEVVREGKVDFNALKATLGEDIELSEKYGLSWKGKSNVFAKIQEKTVSTLHPQPEESVDWDTTQNMFIEGDNLETLKVLHKAYYGKIKMIYIDPPYNTGNDFVYNDDFKKTRREQALEEGAIDDEGNITRDDGLRVNTGGHKHSNWLDMMYPRLFLARNLLRQDGVIFVSIDDNEVYNLRLMMNEIFGEDNFIAQLVWKARPGNDARAKTGVSTDHEYALVYARDINELQPFKGSEKDLSKFSNPDNDPRGPWRSADLTGLATRDARPNLHYSIQNPETGDTYEPARMGWAYERTKMQQKIDEGRVLWPKSSTGRPRHKLFLNEMSILKTFPSIISNVNTGHGSKELGRLFDQKVFDFPKPASYLKMFIDQTTQDDDIIMDFFSGSGTLGQAVAELNMHDGGRRVWICVQLPEKTSTGTEAHTQGFKTIAEIARERIRRAGAKISKDFADKIAERETPLDLGFRSYVLDDSNFKKWNELVAEPDEIKQQALDSLNPLEEGVADDDLLTEILLKRGISPLAAVETHEGFVFVPSENLAISLSRHMTEDLFAQILTKSPSQIILLDQAFRDDVNLKTNLILQAEKQGTFMEIL